MSQEAHSYRLSRGCRINREGHSKLHRLGSPYLDICLDGMHIDLDFKRPTPCWLQRLHAASTGKLCGCYQRTIIDEFRILPITSIFDGLVSG